MSDFIRFGHWRKGKALACVFISLCVLVISFIFVPDLGKFPERTSAPPSIYPYCENYSWVPVAFRVSDNLHRVSRAGGITYRKVASPHHAVVSSQLLRYSISNPGGISNCFSSFDSVFKGGFQQACQLLDIPPPS